MRNTGFSFSGKPLASLSIGCMRFDGREQTKEIVRHCAENGVLYLDTSPFYCFRSESENTETWVGNAIKGIRDKVILSAKCSTGNGGNEIGEYNKTHGFSVTTADRVRELIEQSLRRLDVDSFDVYQLWAVHTDEVYQEAFKKGGWLEGVMKAKEEGLLRHLGMTTHSGNAFIKTAVDQGIFETITVPFHLMDNSRLEGLKYALEKNVAPIAMNPLAGGTLGQSGRPAAALVNSGIESVTDLSLRYIESFGFSALAGMSNIDQAKRNTDIMKKPALTEEEAAELRERFLKIANAEKFKCTTCGYCMPCPEGIDIPGIFKLWNGVNVLGNTENSAELDRAVSRINCTKCGACEKKCPNSLEIIKMLENVTGG
ncbi:MAG: aldo/keto reductase [Oscillospiraceae bacterium]|nr:aldo/keto reductase [Oscillospiraceae bacterium]